MRMLIALVVLLGVFTMPLQARGDIDKFSGEWQGDGRIWLIHKDPSSQTKCSYSAYNSRHKPPVNMQAFVDSSQSTRMEVKHIRLDDQNKEHWPGYHDAHNSYHTACLLNDTLLIYRPLQAPEDMPVRTEGSRTHKGPWDSAEWLEVKASGKGLKVDVWRAKTETVGNSDCWFSGCGEITAINDLRYSFVLEPIDGTETTQPKIIKQDREEKDLKQAEGAEKQAAF